jgi:hypothetical protein
MGSVFGDEAIPHVDIIPEARSVDIIFAKEPSVEGINREGADRGCGARSAENLASRTAP